MSITEPEPAFMNPGPGLFPQGLCEEQEMMVSPLCGPEILLHSPSAKEILDVVKSVQGNFRCLSVLSCWPEEDRTGSGQSHGARTAFLTQLQNGIACPLQSYCEAGERGPGAVWVHRVAVGPDGMEVSWISSCPSAHYT